MGRLTAALILLLASSAAAQVQHRPTDAPLVTAVNESWYRLGEPVQFAGDLYYRAGAAVFFNGNTMVRSGHYNGVPIYVDTTVEPFSIILVPIDRGLMQPYERWRRGDLAGTTGSRAPAFPVQPIPDTVTLPVAAVAPTAAPLPPGAISVYTPEMRTSVPSPPIADILGTTGVAQGRGTAIGTARPQPAGQPRHVVIGQRPESNDGVWIQFNGEKWVSAGRAVRLTADNFVRVGEYAGLPVFARRSGSDRFIYLPTSPDLVAPYRKK